LRRHPELLRFVTDTPPMPGIPGARRISNGTMTTAPGEPLPFATLQAIAAGVPRSFPFHGIALHFHAPQFGDLTPVSAVPAGIMPGILISDSWWVTGRMRSMAACVLVEADLGSKKLPALPETVAALLAACGKIKRTVQLPLPGELPSSPAPPASANPEAAAAVKSIVLDYRARMKEIAAQAKLPHELPPPGVEALRGAGPGVSSGPRKPVLERVFKPLGYSCRAASGTFTLRRRTAGNLTVELHLDVGTWGRSVFAVFRIFGVGFKATLTVPVSAAAMAAAQYPIGDADRWRKIVENLGAMVAELDRSFVPEIEAAAGPSPEWYQPG
jgi:hypothetical protein